MTNAIATNSVPFGAFEIFQMTNKAAGLKSALTAWTNRRATRRALKPLTISQLNDIGLPHNF